MLRPQHSRAHLIVQMQAMRTWARPAVALNTAWARGMASKTEKPMAMKAFPVFKGVHGVLESNEQYVHHVTHGAPPLNSAQRAARAAAEQQERMEEAAGDVLMHPSETPVMLENLPSLCRAAVVSIHTFNPCNNANTVGGGALA